MKIEVRYFASLVELTGSTSESIEIVEDADVASVWKVLIERHPGLASLPFRPMVACDMNYADWETPVVGVREIAFLPPVSGG